jgi:hypothetical protein
MQDEPAGPPSWEDDPDAVVAHWRRQIDHQRRWFQWELWKMEPRSFAPPGESERPCALDLREARNGGADWDDDWRSD